MKFKKGDNVIITVGKDKGKNGKIIRIFRATDRLVVEGVNLSKRRIRPRQAGAKGQVVDVALPLNASNVLHFCGHCKKGVRVGQDIKKSGKIRVCVKCRAVV